MVETVGQPSFADILKSSENTFSYYLNFAGNTDAYFPRNPPLLFYISLFSLHTASDATDDD